MVRRLVRPSAGYARDGYLPEVLERQSQLSGAIAETSKGTPMYDWYMALASHPEDVPRAILPGPV